MACIDSVTEWLEQYHADYDKPVLIEKDQTDYDEPVSFELKARWLWQVSINQTKHHAPGGITKGTTPIHQRNKRNNPEPLEE